MAPIESTRLKAFAVVAAGSGISSPTGEPSPDHNPPRTPAHIREFTLRVDSDRFRLDRGEALVAVALPLLVTLGIDETTAKRIGDSAALCHTWKPHEPPCRNA